MKALLGVCLLCFGLISSESCAQGVFLDAFGKLGTEGKSIDALNNLHQNPKGGHIQGVQIKRYGLGEYAILTGSSNAYSYYAVVRLGLANEVISINKILEKPFKHAGGFQVAGNWLAMGIEDDNSKKSSKVYICQLGNIEQEPVKPYIVIEREGDAKRSTAGCVAIAEKDAGLLLIVGDWDTRHLDFYLIDDRLKYNQIYSIDVEKLDRKGWINEEWLAYQNINLVREGEGYYLVGLGSKNDEDIADVYRLDIKDWKEFGLVKVATKNFGKQDKTKFRWAAGVDVNEEGQLRVVSANADIKHVVLDFFE